MRPDVETLIELAAPSPARGPDVARIVAGGRRLRTKRRVTFAVAGTLSIAALALVAPALLDTAEAPVPERGRVAPAAPTGPKEPFRDSRPLKGPAYVDRIVGEEAYLVGEKEVLASGVVLGEPWSMVEIVTTEGSGDVERLCVEFFLGKDGMLGGGTGCATPDHAGKSLLTLKGQYWGQAPDVVAMFGSVQRPAVAARVHLDDGRTRPLEIMPSAKDDRFGWYVFFPPPFEEGRVVAFDAAGNALDSEPICFPIEAGGGFSMEPPPRSSNVGCSR